MNKSNLLLLLIFNLTILITTSSFSQEFENVVKVEKTNKTILYQRALRWFVQNLENSNYTIKLKDSVKNEVYVKTNFSTDVEMIKGNIRDWVSALDRKIYFKANVSLSIQILTKDNRFRYLISISNIETIDKINNENYSRTKKTTNKINEINEQKVNSYVNRLIENLVKHMKNKSNFEREDW